MLGPRYGTLRYCTAQAVGLAPQCTRLLGLQRQMRAKRTDPGATGMSEPRRQGLPSRSACGASVAVAGCGSGLGARRRGLARQDCLLHCCRCCWGGCEKGWRRPAALLRRTGRAS